MTFMKHGLTFPYDRFEIVVRSIVQTFFLLVSLFVEPGKNAWYFCYKNVAAQILELFSCVTKL